MKYCDICDKYYSENDIYCLKCNRRLSKYCNNNASSVIKNTILRHDSALANPNRIRQPAIQAESKTQVPICPTCGCAEIKRISTTEKVVSTVALGFFSNKRRQQFECLNPNCGYRW